MCAAWHLRSPWHCGSIEGALRVTPSMHPQCSLNAIGKAGGKFNLNNALGVHEAKELLANIVLAKPHGLQ